MDRYYAIQSIEVLTKEMDLLKQFLCGIEENSIYLLDKEYDWVLIKFDGCDIINITDLGNKSFPKIGFTVFASKEAYPNYIYLTHLDACRMEVTSKKDLPLYLINTRPVFEEVLKEL